MFSKKRNDLNNFHGFTLIELLIVIAVLAILATVVFVALNPLARFQDARNSRRWTDVNAIMGAIKLYQVDKKGFLPPITLGGQTATITYGVNYQIGGNGTDCNDSNDGAYCIVTMDTDCMNLSSLVTAGYMPNLPVDPNGDSIAATAERTKYYFRKNANNSITIGACGVEEGSNASSTLIEVTR